MLPSSSAGFRQSAVPLRAPSPGSAVMQHADSGSRCSGFPDSVLLDTVAHMGRCRDNATTASVETRDGCLIEVSFTVADPPSLTRCVVYCSNLTSGIFFDDPPRIIGADGAFLLLTVTFPMRSARRFESTDLFVYKSGPGKPTLEVIPRPYPIGYRSDHVGVLSCGDHCLVVIPDQRPDADGLLSYDLHIFSSKTKSWSIKVVRLDYCAVTTHGCFLSFTKVLALGGGSIAWVDLRYAVLLCDAIAGDPKARLIQLPLLEPFNAKLGVGWDGRMPFLDSVRDVTFSRNDSCFRLIELGFLRLDDKSGQLNFAWRAAMSKRRISCPDDNSDEWKSCGTVDSASLTPSKPCYPHLFPEIFMKNKIALNNVICSFPTLDPYHKNVVYMKAKMKADDSEGWVLVANTKTKKLKKIVPFSSERLYLCPTYMLCAFSKHLRHATGAGNIIGWKHDISMEDPLVPYVISVLLVQQKFRQLEKHFTKERPSALMTWKLIDIGVSASTNVHIHQVAQYAAKTDLGKACDAENTFQRALEDVGNLLQRYCRDDPLVRGNVVGDQINVAVGALDKLLHILPSEMLDSARSMVSVDESVNDGMSVSTQ